MKISNIFDISIDLEIYAIKYENFFSLRERLWVNIFEISFSRK